MLSYLVAPAGSRDYSRAPDSSGFLKGMGAAHGPLDELKPELGRRLGLGQSIVLAVAG
jgi:hypothetical protein